MLPMDAEKIVEQMGETYQTWYPRKGYVRFK
jgi:hypothetical protein